MNEFYFNAVNCLTNLGIPLKKIEGDLATKHFTKVEALHDFKKYKTALDTVEHGASVCFPKDVSELTDLFRGIHFSESGEKIRVIDDVYGLGVECFDCDLPKVVSVVVDRYDCGLHFLVTNLDGKVLAIVRNDLTTMIRKEFFTTN